MVFGDEKLQKGYEIYNPKVRHDPISGCVSQVEVHSDFRIIVGYYTIDPTIAPIDCYSHDVTNDAQNFVQTVVMSVKKGWLKPFRVLVLDNASIHHYKSAESLEDYLFDYVKILVVFLPSRAQSN